MHSNFVKFRHYQSTQINSTKRMKSVIVHHNPTPKVSLHFTLTLILFNFPCTEPHSCVSLKHCYLFVFTIRTSYLIAVMLWALSFLINLALLSSCRPTISGLGLMRFRNHKGFMILPLKVTHAGLDSSPIFKGSVLMIFFAKL